MSLDVYIVEVLKTRSHIDGIVKYVVARTPTKDFSIYIKARCAKALHFIWFIATDP